MSILCFWLVTLCRYQHFRETYSLHFQVLSPEIGGSMVNRSGGTTCLHLQGPSPEGEDSVALQKVCIDLKVDTALHPINPT